MNAAINNYLGHDFERGFQLEALRVEPGTGEVTGPAGREKLDPKVMGVFLMLAQNGGRVVSRDDLHDRLWANAVVTDDALTRCIHELRRQLRRAGGEERYSAMIETLPKRGYRLTGTVTPLEPRAVAPEPLRLPRAWVATAGVALAVATIIVLALHHEAEPPAVAVTPSVAVLPFVDMSETQDQRAFADGVAEEILNRLMRSRDLRVIARTSSFSFRDSTRDIQQIAAQLGVSHVLEGSVRRSGDQVRITAHLIAAADESHVWSATYDRRLGELFAAQDEIASAVAIALDAALVSSEPHVEVPPDPAAYELFLQATFYYNRRAPGDIERAAAYFRDALAIAPEFARGWAALAGAYNILAHAGDTDRETMLTLQGDAAHKAVELAPRLAVAHARLAQYYHSVGDPEFSKRHYQIAVVLDPNDSLVMGFSTDDAVRRGDILSVVETWRRLVERDPLSSTNRNNYANALALAGNHELAVQQYRKALELNPDFHWSVHFEIARIFVRQGDVAAADAAIWMLQDGEPRDYGLALLHEVPGRGEEADAALRRIAASPVTIHNIYVAEIYAMRGMADEAFAALEATRNAIVQVSADGPRPGARIHDLQMAMLLSVDLWTLRSDDRWQAMMVKPPAMAAHH